jgi:hypothetical protein
MKPSIRDWRRCRAWTIDATARERLAFQAGMRFCARHGARPAFVDQWNGASPYCKTLMVPTRRGPRFVRWRRRQVERIAWELGWEYERRARRERSS